MPPHYRPDGHVRSTCNDMELLSFSRTHIAGQLNLIFVMNNWFHIHTHFISFGVLALFQAFSLIDWGTLFWVEQKVFEHWVCSSSLSVGSKVSRFLVGGNHLKSKRMNFWYVRKYSIRLYNKIHYIFTCTTSMHCKYKYSHELWWMIITILGLILLYIYILCVWTRGHSTATNTHIYGNHLSIWLWQVPRTW